MHHATTQIVLENSKAHLRVCICQVGPNRDGQIMALIFFSLNGLRQGPMISFALADCCI